MRTASPGFVAAALVWTAVASPVTGHDFWLEPSAYLVPPGAPLTISFREGHGEGLELPRNASRLVRFELHGPTGVLPVRGVDRAHPAGALRGLPPGRYVAAYTNTPAPFELEADRFARYLEEKGLERVAALRRERGEEGEPGRERFYRSVKCLLQVGEPPPGRADRRLGLPLELVAETDPVLGDELEVRLFFRGAPVAGVLVLAEARDSGAAPREARTTADGVVRFQLEQPGRWILKAVHAEPAPVEAGVEWESWWASLTFRVAGGAPADTGTN